MSLSEVFDHGAVIPWANFRFNNVSIDGTNNTIVSPPPTGGASGTISRLTSKGTTILSTTTPVNVYTFTLPVTTSNPNGTFRVTFTTLFKGGANGLFQQTEAYGVSTAGNTVVSNLFVNIFNVIGTNTFGQNATVNTNTLSFTVTNTNATQIANVLWYAQVDYFITNI